jgi:hypothetical protein
MAKKGTTPTTRKPTRKEASRAARDARFNRWVISIAIAVGLLVVGILVFGYLNEVVLVTRRPVATVNGTPISLADWQARFREQRVRMQMQLDSYSAQRMEVDPTDPNASALLQQLDQAISRLRSQMEPETLGQAVLKQMAQEEIIRQEAARRGISIAPEEIDRAIETFFGFDREAAPTAPPLTTGPVTQTETVTPTTPAAMTEQEFQDTYQSYVENVLNPSGLGVEGFRAMMEAMLLSNEVRTAIESEVPTATEQVQMRYFSCNDGEVADTLHQRLEAGEAWDDIAADLEENPITGTYASEPWWVTQGFVAEQFGTEISIILFATPVGSYTMPMLSSATGATYVMQVLNHEEHELDSLMLNYEQSHAFNEWLNQQMMGVTYSEDWRNHLPTN